MVILNNFARLFYLWRTEDVMGRADTRVFEPWCAHLYPLPLPNNYVKVLRCTGVLIMAPAIYPTYPPSPPLLSDASYNRHMTVILVANRPSYDGHSRHPDSGRIFITVIYPSGAGQMPLRRRFDDILTHVIQTSYTL